MKKTFILDTNVLLHDPQSLFGFADNDVIIPITVIEEIDRFKKELTEVGRNARQLSRSLDQLRAQGHLTDGVATPDGGTLRIALNVPTPRDFPFYESAGVNDIKILLLAWQMTRTRPPVVFITKDSNLRIKADAVGVNAEDFVERARSFDPEAVAWTEVTVAREVVDRLFAEKSIPLAEIDVADPGPNAGVLLKDAADPQHQALARRRPREAALAPVAVPKQVSGIRPRNVEQRLALDLLLDPDVPLVTLLGKAGTGKTLLALAAGLMLTVEKRLYRRLLVARPIFPMGRDLGYLPGDVDEKLRPWMQPIYDNLEYLLGEFGPSTNPEGHPIDQLLDRGLLEVEPLTYIRGRSLPKQYMIVDEAQNLTPHEVKTVVTRAGEGTKIVLTGDPAQIDNPYVDAASNGLSFASQRMRGEPLAGTAYLSRGERSPLAEMAADHL